MAKKEDLRIIKTKAALTNSFFALLEEMTLEDITVNGLCEKAGVRRATFYKHFTDKNDFILYLIKDVRERFEHDTWNKNGLVPVVTKEYYLKYAEAVIQYLLTRENAIKKIIDSSVRSTFIEVFVQQNYKDTKKKLEISAKGGMNLISSPDVVASMLVGGTSRAIVNWFENTERCPVNVLLRDIFKIIDRVLS